MNRRETFRLLIFTALGSLIPSSKIFALNNEKINEEDTIAPIDPVTGVTIGLSAAKLFIGMFQSNSGPTIIDFIRNTNEQLDIISKKIDILFNDVNELKGLIQELPTEIVSKLKQIELKAKIDDYKAVLLEVSLNTYKGNILKYVAVPENKQKVSRIVDSIKEIKSELRQINDPFLVPFVAIGIHMEYYLRNNFLQQRWENFIGDINNDASWLNDYVFKKVNSIKNNLYTLRNTRKSLLENNILTFSVQTDRLGQQYIYSILLKPEIDNGITEEKEIENLRDIGLILENERSLKFIMVNPEKRYYTFFPATDPPEYPYQSPDSIRERLITAKNNALKLNYFSIIAFTTAYYAGLKAIEFCNVYLKAANLNKS